MTNELLAQLIGEGGNDELIPLLWEHTRRWFGTLSADFTRRYCDRCLKYGVTTADVKQECFFALLDAVKNYCRRPENQKDLKFITYCEYPFKKHAFTMIGMTTNKESGRRDAHVNAQKSLEESIKFNDSKSEAEEKTWLDNLADDGAIERAENEAKKIEAEDNKLLVSVILNKIIFDSKEREVIIRFYLKEDTLISIAKDWGWTVTRVKLLRDRTIKKLKEHKRLMDYNYVYDAYSGTGLTSFRRNWCSVVERLVEEWEWAEERRNVLKELINYCDTNSNKEPANQNAPYKPNFEWTYDETLIRQSKRAGGFHKNINTDAIIKTIQEDKSISTKQIKEMLHIDLAESSLNRIIRNLGYTKQYKIRPYDRGSAKSRVWIRTSGTARNLGESKKYDVDTALLERIIQENPSITREEIKEKLNTPMSVSNLGNYIRALGYTRKYVYA